MSIKDFEETVKNLARGVYEDVGAHLMRIEINVEPYMTRFETQVNFRSFYEEDTADAKQQSGGCRG